MALFEARKLVVAAVALLSVGKAIGKSIFAYEKLNLKFTLF